MLRNVRPNETERCLHGRETKEAEPVHRLAAQKEAAEADHVTLLSGEYRIRVNSDSSATLGMTGNGGGAVLRKRAGETPALYPPPDGLQGKSQVNGDFRVKEIAAGDGRSFQSVASDLLRRALTRLKPSVF